MEAHKNKDALFWRDKSFPYYDDLFALYDGRYAEGRSCRGMDHYANKSPSASIPALGSFSFDIEEYRDDTNWFGNNEAFTPLGTFLPQKTPDGPSSINIAPHVPEQFEETLHHSARPSSSTPEAVDGKRDKRQKTKHTITTDHFHEKYLKLEKEEIE
ncbi:unnamed protein product [Miscanthus lutarioriparius]|uniref:Uncharacterized protein n=1 Tax=Miscanthus lutarioriparius TaxID=422564 RepID=A0A811NWD1_9POAL|nr:unnamed protein product [Miscanthus lutarioriparius]